MGLCTGLIGVLLNIVLPLAMYWSRFRGTLGMPQLLGLAGLLAVGVGLGVACFVVSLNRIAKGK